MIRGSYPILRPERTGVVVLSSGGAAPTPQELIWRFGDLEQKWRVSLAPEFLAFETTSYTSRSDFLIKFGEALVALSKCISPRTVDRLGVRYIDRVTGVDNIRRLLRPEICGIAGTAVAAHAQHFLSQAAFEVDNSQFVAKWGYLPSNASLDPSALEPINEPSWILDLDMFRASSWEFDIASLVKEARAYAERIYAFFRWAVTEEFLRRYGGTP